MDTEGFRKILSLAINREIESYTFYRGVADKVSNPELKKLFAELAGEEVKHRETLTEFLAKPPKSLKFDASRDYKIAETLKTPNLTPNLKPIDGMVIAIQKELEAMQMYTQLASRSTDADQKKIFIELASMERGHKARLEDIYTNMAFPEVW
ncbi:MAG: ferritin family protein [Methanomicrobiales archaeon]|nr:ferritin family protein [Methanomicrobiales archaeon]